ncbi:uncharacterized protein [Branchiostoma lanceolatum]|uniref:uncharacterized protein n=1 Tax=Branchiostoma lanceolatum TaxID=7740 RepID=UPI0034514BE9
MEGASSRPYEGSRAEWILLQANDFDRKSRETRCGGCGGKKANWVCLDAACVAYNRGNALCLCDGCDAQFHPQSSPVMVGHRRLATVLYMSLQLLYRNRPTAQSFPESGRNPKPESATAREPYPTAEMHSSHPQALLPSPPVSPNKMPPKYDRVKKEIIENPSQDMHWEPSPQPTVVNQDRAGETVLPKTRLFSTEGPGQWTQPPVPADSSGPAMAERPVDAVPGGNINTSPPQNGARSIEYRATFGNNLRPIHNRYARILSTLRQSGNTMSLPEAFSRESFSKLSVKNCLGIAELRLLDAALYQKVFEGYKQRADTTRITVAGLEQECRRVLAVYRRLVKEMRDRGDLLPFFDVTY